MTTDEIKQSVSMRSVVESYGIRIDRKNFCCCPFHNEKTPSMKIASDNFYCFGCGATGDVFSFVQRMDGCDFKTAFKTLGGSYKEQTNYGRDLHKYRLEMQKRRATERQNAIVRERKTLVEQIPILNACKTMYEPFSNEWCDATNKLEKIYARLEELQNEKERR